MSLRPILHSRRPLANNLRLSEVIQNTQSPRFRHASRLSRRTTARPITPESQELPVNTPKTLSSWEKVPAVPPKKAYWKTAVLFAYIGGPAYAFYSWSTWKPALSS